MTGYRASNFLADEIDRQQEAFERRQKRKLERKQEEEKKRQKLMVEQAINDNKENAEPASTSTVMLEEVRQIELPSRLEKPSVSVLRSLLRGRRSINGAVARKFMAGN
ncbi:unnamed protein product [Bursaphelenchus okinawaensis]|uniref:Uncharacterized protein n=1 Tax=Bursaphelenchus okinawaensis TaxID=465554 RepID=A0A811LNT9_9BILA|nr:unnamed protein product [Bursaphelenchus okinawaensis]CAG9125078.1 unnamed protein product [Bursaphelenchus okinawaensis]